ncbi:uncharacterized protein [Henckelia pumila]|uniref:uncharacterized protein n=1 Tax=Henckelia pumila TaxID=405737 RepID=UPI003C6E1A3D
MEIPYSGTAQRPPTLDGSNYAIWKVKMRVYIKSIDEKVWQRVLQDWSPPRRTDGEGDFLLKPETDWNAEETAISNMNNKALNAIFTSLDFNMFALVANCVCAKWAWEKLQMHCEGSESGVNESDLGDESIALLTKQFGNYLKRMRDSKKPGQKSKESITPTGGRPLRIGGSNQNITSSKNPLQTQKEGFGHYASECPTRLRRGMSASLSDDEDEEGVSTLGHNTEQKLFCLNISVPKNLNDQDVCDNELSLKDSQKMYEELFTDWVMRNKSNSALSKENSELKAAVARLEVILSKKDMELYRLKEELGRDTATFAKFNSSKAKLDSMLMIGQNDRTGLGFENSKFEVGESSKTVFIKENSHPASSSISLSKENSLPPKTLLFRGNERGMLHPVLPTLHQNTAKKKNTEKNIWVPKTKSNCNVVYTSMKTNVAGSWYFVSGCSRHMTGSKEYLVDYVKQDKGKVTYGGGAQGKIVGKGTLNVEGLPRLHNVLHVEGLTANLISISQLCDDDLYVKFNKTLCEVFDKNNLCVLTGSRSSDNCYQLGEDIA